MYCTRYFLLFEPSLFLNNQDSNYLRESKNYQVWGRFYSQSVWYHFQVWSWTRYTLFYEFKKVIGENSLVYTLNNNACTNITRVKYKSVDFINNCGSWCPLIISWLGYFVQNLTTLISYRPMIGTITHDDSSMLDKLRATNHLFFWPYFPRIINLTNVQFF